MIYCGTSNQALTGDGEETIMKNRIFAEPFVYNTAPCRDLKKQALHTKGRLGATPSRMGI